MSVEKVREYLTPYGVADRMREFEVSSAIELTCDELERCCGKNFVQWVDVCKGWQPEEA